ncbi:MAG: DoxX family protein [Solirubrobacteraceae bacterium]|nr:DoxX family protein [Solirubrobacteraceae bacterium]
MPAPLTVLSRIAVGVPFAVLGSNLVRNPDPLVPVVERSGLPIPIDTRTAVLLNGATMVGGGLAIASGAAPRTGALAIAAMLVPTTIAGHPFWAKDGEPQRTISRNEFTKNVALAGGLLAVAGARGSRRARRRAAASAAPLA